MNAPEKLPPGVAHKLRLTVRDENADALLARMTDLETRQTLPGFLYVFSTHSYLHATDDYYDGRSQKEATLSGYRRRLNDYNLHHFGLGSEVELEGRRLIMQATLGFEAASRIYSPPFGQKPFSTTLEVMYRIPGQEPIDERAVDDLRAFAAEGHRSVFDELALVTGATALRPFIIRSRERPDDILQS